MRSSHRRALLYPLLLGLTLRVHATTCIGVHPVVRTSSLAGQVFERLGAMISGAKVTVTAAGRTPIVMGTDERGFFAVPGLPPGSYEIAIVGEWFPLWTATAHIGRALPFQLLVARVGSPMGCDAGACTIVLSAPAPLRQQPECLAGPSPERVAKAQRGLELLSGACDSGDGGACRRLFRIARDDKDSSRREDAARRLNDQGLLAELARSAPDTSVRHHCVGRLNGEAALAALATRDSNADIRAGATARLQDGALLARVATDKDAYVRRAAAGNVHLDDPARLASLAEDSDVNVRVAALGNPSFTDPALFTRLAETGENPLVRAAAVGRLTDAEKLRQIATSNENVYERRAAISNAALRDDGLFADRARNDPEEWVRQAAFRRIDDPALRSEVAPFVEKEAVRALVDPARIADVAKHARDSALRSAATEKITDPQMLAEILSVERDEYVRRSAVINPALTDQRLLGRVAPRDPSPIVRLAAARKLENRDLAQRVLEGVANADGPGRWLWAEQAVSSMRDQAVLAEIAKTDNDANLRRAAVWQLVDPSQLAEIARSDASSQVRTAAVAKIADEGVLGQIATNDPDWFVRRHAEERLKELKPPR